MRAQDLQLELLSAGIPVCETQITTSPLARYGGGASMGYLYGIAESFDAAQVWADVSEGGKVGQYQQQKADNQCGIVPKGIDPAHDQLCATLNAKIAQANSRGNRGANAIRDGLRELGYSPGNNNTAWGSQDSSAWKQFAADHGAPAGPGLVSKAGIEAMEKALQGGGGGGGGGGGTEITKSKWFWPAVGAAAAVGAVVLFGGGKK